MKKVLLAWAFLLVYAVWAGAQAPTATYTAIAPGWVMKTEGPGTTPTPTMTPIVPTTKPTPTPEVKHAN